MMKTRFTAAHTRLIAILLTAGCALDADTIVLRDGREYEGVLERATATEIEFRRNDEISRYPRADVVHIRLQRRREWDQYTEAAQIPDALLQECLAEPVTAADFPGAGSYVLHDGVFVRIRTAQEWTENRRLVVRILNEHGEDRSVQALGLRNDAERVRIRHGIAILPDRTVLHLRDSAVQQEALYAGLPRYDTISVRRFALPAGKPGTVLDIATERERHTPLPLLWFHHEYLFGGMDPSRAVQVEILVPADCPLRWQLLNDADGEVRYTRTVQDDHVLHRWRRENMAPLLPESMMPPLADVVPRLVVSTQPGTWEEIGRDFARRLGELQARYPDPGPAPAATGLEICDYVNRNILEHPVALAATGPLPADPAETRRLRSGAPLDRVYLLYRWLQAGADSDPKWTWIRPRSMGKLAAEVPSLGAFTIPALHLAGRKPAYLVPGDELDAPEEGAAGLGGCACLTADTGLQSVPLAPAAAFGHQVEVSVTLDRDGNAKVRETTVYRGSAARGLRAWRHYTQEEIRNRVENLVRDLDTRAEAIRYQVDDVQRNTASHALHLQYDIPGFADRRPTLVSLNPPWLGFDAQAVGRDTRRYPLFWSRPRRDTLRVEIRHPAGFPLYAMPEQAECSRGPATLRVTGTRGEHSAQLEVVYERAASEAPPTAYDAFQECLRTRAQIGRQYWVWRRPPP